ncbi:mRNA decay activator protein ZFP36L3-like isoform X1 [Leguminivora glycinivorella]|uniref:mRNA decay activator protein ZFP36L3-like isoform X1 n=1 Tax=Leguminivora glycinivorella TaxID=1035111 RepID=UPI00200F1084|nr:mRNA decay activator protein ZFP36L3-like isoform X1 [Leguminivora glycinivorella]
MVRLYVPSKTRIDFRPRDRCLLAVPASRTVARRNSPLLACLCCLTPPALGSITLLKAAAVAKGAALLKAAAVAKGAALLGAGALIKGAAIKGAIKGAAAKGAAILAAKGAAVKGALAIAAKAADIAVHKLPPVKPVQVIEQPAPAPIVIPAYPLSPRC